MPLRYESPRNAVPSVEGRENRYDCQRKSTLHSPTLTRWISEERSRCLLCTTTPASASSRLKQPFASLVPMDPKPWLSGKNKMGLRESSAFANRYLFLSDLDQPMGPRIPTSLGVRGGKSSCSSSLALQRSPVPHYYRCYCTLVLSALERLGHDSLRRDDVNNAAPPAQRVAIYRCQEALRHGLEKLVLVLE